LFKGKKSKIKKEPLTIEELLKIERKTFSSDRLSIVRDIFVFQCYTGLAYIDAFNLTWTKIKQGIDGKRWIMSDRQKSNSDIDVPLLPKAIEIMERYRDHPICIKRGTVLPVKSNQKMNDYLKEIATLCNIDDNLTTHKARRTFASTVALANGVPIHIVKALLGHHSVQQTEEYAITGQEAVSREMEQLEEKLISIEKTTNPKLLLKNLEKELKVLKGMESSTKADLSTKLLTFQQQLTQLKKELKRA